MRIFTVEIFFADLKCSGIFSDSKCLHFTITTKHGHEICGNPFSWRSCFHNG